MLELALTLVLMPTLQDPSFDINALERESNATVLHHAAINSKMRVLEYVFSARRGSAPCSQPRTGASGKLTRTRARRFIFSDPALRERADVDALGGEMQTTPLFWAAYHNHIYAVEILLRHGADPTITDELGSCPFLLAIQVRPQSSALLCGAGV